MNAAPALPVLYRRSLKKWLLYLMGSLVFVGVGILMIRDHQAHAYFVTISFGLCAVLFAVNLHPRSSYLELNEAGFAFARLFRRSFVRWPDVTEFYPITVGSQSMVGWNYSSDAQRHRALSRLSSALAGSDAALPDTYGMSVEDLAGLLNTMRQRYGK